MKKALSGFFEVLVDWLTQHVPPRDVSCGFDRVEEPDGRRFSGLQLLGWGRRG